MVTAEVSLTPTISIRRFLMAGFLFFIPFSQALTVNLLFPLKLSEVCLFLLVAHDAITGKIIQLKLPKLIGIFLLAFAGLILSSVIINAIYQYPYPLTTTVTRVNPAVDSLLKFFYFLLSLFALIFTFNAFKRDQSYYKYFFAGAIASSCYAWYLFASGILHIPVFLLPGMDVESQTYDTGFGEVIRSSTFKEGNYMGFYLLVVTILAYYRNRKLLAAFFFLTILTTFSTTAIVCVGVSFVMHLIYKYKRYKVRLITILALSFLTVVVLVNVSATFKQLFYDKIFGTPETVENVNDIYSKTDRLNTAGVAMEITADNPLLGVGLSNFGLHFEHYNEFPELVQEVKKIPNNIYAEILSECGIPAFLMFLAFSVMVFKRAKVKSPTILRAGLFGFFIYFFAFPTFTMLFIWVFIGIVIS